VGQVPDTDAGQVKGWAGELDAPTRPGSAGRGVKSVGVFPAYASSRGHALVDRELYLPRRWTDDLALCAEAGVPEQFAFRTKPQLTQAMLERAVTAGVTAGWVTGDTIYGGDRRLRIWLEKQAIAYVLAVKRTEPLWTWIDRGPDQVPAERLLALVPAEQWLRISAGQGPKANASMTGSERRCTATAGRPTWGSGCLPAARSTIPKTWPSMRALGRRRRRWRTWSESPRSAGRSRRPSSRPRARSAWTTTRSAAGPPGIGRSSVGVGDPGRHDGWLSPQEAVGERGDRGVLGGPGLPDSGGPRPHRLGARPPNRPWRRPRRHRTPSSPRYAQGSAGAARTGRACPSAGARHEPRDRSDRGPAPGASRPGHKRPRWAGRHRPPRRGRAGRRRHPRSADAGRAPAQGGSAQSPAPRRTPASTPARRSCADPRASRWQAAAARSPGRWSRRS
jgi:hypothetical protein